MGPRRIARTITGLAAVTAAVAMTPASAGAATQLGETFSPPNTCDPGVNVQSSSPGNSYAAAFAGVITSWSYQASTATQVKLKIVRPVGGNSFQVVGESGPVMAAAGSLVTTAARISVAPGDVLGTAGTSYCARSLPGSGYLQHVLYPGDPAPGSTDAYTGPFPFQLDVAATLEPDCDGDGFGDETQDPQIPVIAACDPDPPETTITKQPKDRTKRKQAEFAFTSSEPGSSFECALDGSPFAACTSPLIRKVGKGKHVFQVRAVDPAGNADGSPAVDDWKVKKKKKKR